MSKEKLNGADVGALLQEVHGEGVPHGMRVIGLQILQIQWAFWHSRSTAARVMCSSGRSPGKSQCCGLSARHQARKISKSFGESIT